MTDIKPTTFCKQVKDPSNRAGRKSSEPSDNLEKTMNETKLRMIIIVLKPSFGLLQREHFYKFSALTGGHLHVIKLNK